MRGDIADHRAKSRAREVARACGRGTANNRHQGSAGHPSISREPRICSTPAMLTSDEEIEMEYRGKRYTIVQGVDANSWRWTVYIDEKNVKSGAATTRDSATTNAIWAIDRVLAPKKPKLKSPNDVS
jgi:hypothetical protein